MEQGLTVVMSEKLSIPTTNLRRRNQKTGRSILRARAHCGRNRRAKASHGFVLKINSGLLFTTVAGSFYKLK
jgi:hypothetical protein